MTARPLAGLLARSRRSARATVTCPDCDVTWRGTTNDACWACGRAEATVVAVAQPVRLPS